MAQVFSCVATRNKTFTVISSGRESGSLPKLQTQKHQRLNTRDFEFLAIFGLGFCVVGVSFWMGLGTSRKLGLLDFKHLGFIIGLLGMQSKRRTL